MNFEMIFKKKIRWLGVYLSFFRKNVERNHYFGGADANAIVVGTNNKIFFS
jgi:hypothetical protein